MPFFIPVLGAIAGFVVRRKVAIVAGVLVVTFYDEAGRVIGEFIGEEASEFAQKEIEEAGGFIAHEIEEAAGELADLSLAFIRGVIPALIDGVKAGYDAIRDGFRGKEPETIAALTIGILVVISIFTLLHEVRTGPSGAGEYEAGNRPSPSYPLE